MPKADLSGNKLVEYIIGNDRRMRSFDLNLDTISVTHN